MTTARSSPPEPPRPPLARLVELALIVPVEVGTRLAEAVPAVVDKAPTAVERVRREVVLARFLGKMVVDQGVREIRGRLSPAETPVTAAVPSEPEPEIEPSVEDSATSRVTPDDRDAPDVDTLALADYDHLSSAQIVAKLEGLDGPERAAIEHYELAGRHRRTILGKLEQLRPTEDVS